VVSNESYPAHPNLHNTYYSFVKHNVNVLILSYWLRDAKSCKTMSPTISAKRTFMFDESKHQSTAADQKSTRYGSWSQQQKWRSNNTPYLHKGKHYTIENKGMANVNDGWKISRHIAFSAYLSDAGILRQCSVQVLIMMVSHDLLQHLTLNEN
jgi:hypothetical protein